MPKAEKVSYFLVEISWDCGFKEPFPIDEAGRGEKGMWYNGVEESNMRNKDLISTISREEEERGRNNSVNGQKVLSSDTTHEKI